MRKDFIERQLTPEVMAAALEALAHQWAEAVAEVERLKARLEDQFGRHQQIESNYRYLCNHLRKQLAEFKGQPPDLIDE